jgi:hypothetical protein
MSVRLADENLRSSIVRQRFDFAHNVGPNDEIREAKRLPASFAPKTHYCGCATHVSPTVSANIDGSHDKDPKPLVGAVDALSNNEFKEYQSYDRH